MSDIKSNPSIAANEYHENSDSAQLARLGKKPVLKRDFGFLSMVGFSCTVMISWEAALFTFGVGFSNGGYTGSFIGYLLVWMGNLACFATMAELSSMAPTAAGQYHWVSMLGPKSWRRFLSYVIGWLTVTGWIAVASSVCFLCTTIVQGMAQMTHPDYVISQWQIPLIYWLVLLFAVFFNTVAVRYLPQVEGLVLVLHIFGFFAILIPLVVYGTRTDAAVVFNTWINEGEWQTQGLSFLVGLVGAAFGLLGGDAAVHMSEEIKAPATTVPKAMIACILINGALGFSMLIAELFFLGDADTVLSTPLGFPFMAIFQNAVGYNAGAVTMVAVVFVLTMCCAVSCIATAARLTWAFARDRGLPFWHIWAKVDTRTKVPLLSVGLVSFICVILSFIGFGSTLAFNDVVSLTVANLYTSYLIGNSLLLWHRLKGTIQPYSANDLELSNTMGSKLSWGPWKIPEPFGIIVNILGIAYLIIILIFSFFPVGINPTPATMNWSILMLGAISILALGYYFVLGRRSYTGPVVETDGATEGVNMTGYPDQVKV